MIEDQENTIWPLPKVYFSVAINGIESVFQEVSGLQNETQETEYRKSNSQLFSTIQMPGMTKVGNIVLKRGVFSNTKVFEEWYSQVKMNSTERGPVVIKLIDETGNPTMSWTLKNALPIKIIGTDSDSDGSEINVELIEFTHEVLTVSNV